MRQSVRVTLRHISLKTSVDALLIFLLKVWLIWYFNDSSDYISIISMVRFFHHPLESVLGGRSLQECRKRLSVENYLSQEYHKLPKGQWRSRKATKGSGGAIYELKMRTLGLHHLSDVWSDISEYLRVQDWQKSFNWRNVKTKKENVQ